MKELYDLIILKSSQREIQKIQKDEIGKILLAIKSLAQNPRPLGFKELVGIKNYRVIYIVEDVVRIVEVSGVRHRREAYD
ncbi:type II toxin-antitoxin system RelE family toxin [Dyadobacter bucti]|uniref:type II toxin-antitoxin system RelE family toxin n=1 Tax=Dyadobacter bucti TaxID=2572203 RepID=UPI001109A960|nr:type II toxin-antitoxin system RelE/ParE family toxin [Dyadobacter bucti]